MSISSVIEQLRTRTKAMKVREVADLLNLDPDTVCRYADAQKLPAFKVGSRWRFDPEHSQAGLNGKTGRTKRGNSRDRCSGVSAKGFPASALRQGIRRLT